MDVFVECKKKNFKKTIESLARAGFRYDKVYDSVPMPDKENTLVIRGQVDKKRVCELRHVSGVVAIWADSKINLFGPVK